MAKNSDYKLTLSQWNSLLQEALGQVQLTLRFGRRDGVLFTEVGNVQGLSFDSVYIMGLREGEFPQAKNENWIYNDTERKQLADAGYDLPTVGSSFDEDAYFFAQAVCAAQRSSSLPGMRMWAKAWPAAIWRKSGSCFCSREVRESAWTRTM